MASEYIAVALERLIVERARRRCEYCQCPEEFSLGAFQIEHIYPRSLGGATETENLALSCGGFNNFKGVRVDFPDPETQQSATLFHPRQHLWSEHFRWSEDFLRMEGISQTGRATIDALRLNRPGVFNLRRLLIMDDKHPPEGTDPAITAN